jgi:hypothetical protein
MQLTKEEVENLLAFLDKQYIDRNTGNHLYDGEVIHQWMIRANGWLEEYVSSQLVESIKLKTEN